MAFTLWGSAELLGETDFEYGSPQPGIPTGSFRPTDAGLGLMPLFEEAMAALMAIEPMLQREGVTRERWGEQLGQAVYDAFQRTEEGQRLAASRDAIAALRLELRDATGAVVPTKQITIQNAHQLIPGLADLHDETGPGPPLFPRYVLSVVLTTESASDPR